MLTNGQFFSTFVFTLCAIGVLLALVGIGFVVYKVWIFSRPFREWLRQSWIVRLVRQIDIALGVMMTRVLTFIVVRPWRVFIAFLATLGSMLREIPWGICIGVLVVSALPFFVLASIGMSLQSIIGVVVAGALIGIFCAPFTSWHYRSLGPSKAIGVSFLTIAGGSWGSVMFIAFLIAMASD